jgi:hypothetical protein
MSDQPGDKKVPAAGQPPVSGTSGIDLARSLSSPEREVSGVDPFVELRYRRRGRSISRVVTVRLKPALEGIAEAFEVFFAVG